MVQRANRSKVAGRRKLISPKTLVIVLMITACYAVLVGRIPNRRYAMVYYKMAGDCDDCSRHTQMRLLERSLYHDPAFSDGYAKMGMLCRLENQKEQALAWHRKALMYDPHNPITERELPYLKNM